MAKNSHFGTFFDFPKNCRYDSNETFLSHNTPYYGPMCAMASKLYAWDLRNIAKIKDYDKRLLFLVVCAIEAVHAMDVDYPWVRTDSLPARGRLVHVHRVPGAGLRVATDAAEWGHPTGDHRRRWQHLRTLLLQRPVRGVRGRSHRG